LINDIKSLWNSRTLVGAGIIAFVEALKYVVLKWMVK